MSTLDFLLSSLHHHSHAYVSKGRANSQHFYDVRMLFSLEYLEYTFPFSRLVLHQNRHLASQNCSFIFSPRFLKFQRQSLP